MMTNLSPQNRISLPRYSGGGLGRGFVQATRSSPLPNPPPEYRGREMWLWVLRYAMGVTALIAMAGCGPHQRAQPVDLSKPQTAAIEYVRAIGHGDAVTARATAIGTDEEMRWVDALASLVDGLRQLNGSLYDYFGHNTGQIH